MPQLARNITVTYVSRLAAIAAAFALFPFIAGEVGIEQYGVYLLVYGLTNFFSTDLGIGSSVIRYVSAAELEGDPAELDRVVSTSMAFFVALAAGMAIIFVVVTALVWGSLNIPADQRHTATLLLPIVGVGFVILGPPLSVFRNVLAGLQRYDLVSGFALVQVILRVVLTVPLLLAGFGVIAVAAVEAVAFLSVGLLCAIKVYRMRPALRVSPRLVSRSLLREMAPYSIQVFLMTVSALVILQADNIIIGLVLPVAAVALYTAAYRLYQVCREVTQSIFVPLVSDAARAHATSDHRRVRELLLRGTRLANTLLISLAVPMLVLAGPVLSVWAGAQFAGVAVVAQILLAGLLVNNLHVIAIPILMGAGRLRVYARLHVAWAVSNIVLSVVLASGPLGLKGIALGTAIPVVLLEPLYVREVLRHTGTSWRAFADQVILRSFGVAVPAALVLVAVAHWLHPRSVLAIVAVGALHLVVLWACYLAVNADDRSLVRGVVGRLRRARTPAAQAA